MRLYQRRLLLLCTAAAGMVVVLYTLLQTASVQTLRTTTSIWLTKQNMNLCRFSKLPMLFEHSNDYYYVVWETTCTSGAPLLEWWADDSTRFSIEPWYRQIDHTHHRYTAIFGPVSNASQVHYRINNYRFSTKQYTITRRTKYEPHRVLVIADNQDGPSEFRKILTSIRRYYGASSNPDTILHVGDAVQTASHLDDWQRQLFAPLEDRNSLQHTTPTIFVPGNHDHDKRRVPNNSNIYMDMYHGINDTDGLGKIAVTNGSYHQFYHSVSIGCAQVIVLDAECPSPEQSEFLLQELQSEAFQSARFRIIAVHIPPYMEFWDPYAWEHKGEKHWGEHVRLEYDPLFRKYNVDLVISGHQHNYQRSTVHRAPASGLSDTITYAIVGGAGGTLDLERVEDRNMYNATYLGHHFVALDISKQSLRWTALNVDGRIIDQFKL
ncbi:hypothetical protein IWW36_003450 [Coemansia brasiliensis]|uniref:Calcineurin-like phosphoesterase domain-containing protein n=1 Tax=Coemansia brasiliensis TaxID=2650707 RepID=A0A9W8IBL4_9FUNG|nr:hypothetical protein IWW36_003450 [Coemansia brasiliensis]